MLSCFIFGKIFHMDFAMVAVAAAPVRRKAAHRSEMINQLLFGEGVKLVKEKNERWVKIRSLHDGYEGWVTRNLLEQTDERTATLSSLFTCTEIFHTARLDDKELYISFGASLPFFEDAGSQAGNKRFNYAGTFCKRGEQQPGLGLLEELTRPWLNAPYLWGGRTPLGVDCSGFVQVIYKVMGLDLPRDAWQQAQAGVPVRKFRDARPGDLAFFNNKEEIVHVGILLDENRIIHASGKVRIDRITKKRIENAETGERGLRLRAIRRLWDGSGK